MRYMDTDQAWEHFGQVDPYWAVITWDCFRKENLTQESLGEFFAWGERHIHWVFETVHAKLDAGFAPRTALDFGCGVGRLLLPLAARCPAVVGVDVADSMLRTAQAHCDAAGLSQVQLVKGDDTLSGVTGPFELVNSHMVLQHIPCARGQRLLRRLIELVGEGGVGVLHVTYSKAQLEANLAELWPPLDLLTPPSPPPAPPVLDGIRHHLSGLWRAGRRRVARMMGRTSSPASPVPASPVSDEPTPQMQMNPYTLNPLFHALQTAGVRRFHLEFTDHGGEYGVVLFFQKRVGDTYRA